MWKSGVDGSAALKNGGHLDAIVRHASCISPVQVVGPVQFFRGAVRSHWIPPDPRGVARCPRAEAYNRAARTP
jgi:hypothetical protein